MEMELSREEILTLADRMADTAAHIDAATHTLLTDLRAFDEANGWYELGATSCAHFLGWRIGMSPGVAREKVRVARALAALPRVDAALAEGRLSYSKVRAITRVATADNEEALLDMAMGSTAAQLEKICRLYRQTAPRERSQDERRWLHHRATDDGMVRISIQLRAEEAATVLKAIDVSAERGAPADRLLALAETALTGPSGSGEDGRVRRPVEVMFHVDAQTLTGHAHDTGDGVSAEVSRRLCCDAGIVPVVEERGKTVDVGRKTGGSRSRSSGRSRAGTTAAGFRAAATGTSSTPTTWSTGSTGARPASITWYPYAVVIMCTSTSAASPSR